MDHHSTRDQPLVGTLPIVKVGSLATSWIFAARFRSDAAKLLFLAVTIAITGVCCHDGAVAVDGVGVAMEVMLLTLVTMMTTTTTMPVTVMVMTVIHQIIMVAMVTMVTVMTVIHHQIIMVALPFTSSFALLVTGRLFQVISITISIMMMMIIIISITISSV